MTRAVVCGRSLISAAETLGLEIVSDRADVVLLDVDEEECVRRAADLDPQVPRIVVSGREHATLLRALGAASFSIASGPSASAVGPLLARAAPSTRARTHVVVVTGDAGGCGRTTVSVELALRLATRSLLLLDLTGSGAAAWRLGVEVGPWTDLEGLIQELTADHLAVVAADRAGVRVIGGSGPFPSPTLARAVVQAAKSATDLVLVDAPSLGDERTGAVLDLADRILYLTPKGREGPPASPPADAWVIARGRASAEAFRALPEDPSAARERRPGVPAGGALGRALDELAEVIAIDGAG